MLHGLHFLRQDFVIFNIFGCVLACLDHLVCPMARNYWKLDHTSDSLQIIDSECIYVEEWKLDFPMQILNHFDGVPTDSRKCGQVSAPSSLPEPSFPSFECAGEAGGDSWFENLPFCLLWCQQFWGIFVLHYVAHAVCLINSRDFATGQNGQRRWSLLRSMAELALCSMLCLLLLGVYVRLTKLGTLDYLLIFVC